MAPLRWCRGHGISLSVAGFGGLLHRQPDQQGQPLPGQRSGLSYL